MTRYVVRWPTKLLVLWDTRRDPRRSAIVFQILPPIRHHFKGPSLFFSAVRLEVLRKLFFFFYAISYFWNLIWDAHRDWMLNIMFDNWDWVVLAFFSVHLGWLQRVFQAVLSVSPKTGSILRGTWYGGKWMSMEQWKRVKRNLWNQVQETRSHPSCSLTRTLCFLKDTRIIFCSHNKDLSLDAWRLSDWFLYASCYQESGGFGRQNWYLGHCGLRPGLHHWYLDAELSLRLKGVTTGGTFREIEHIHPKACFQLAALLLVSRYCQIL